MQTHPRQPVAIPTRRMIAVRRWLVPISILVVASLLAAFTTIATYYFTTTPDDRGVHVGAAPPRGIVVPASVENHTAAWALPEDSLSHSTDQPHHPSPYSSEPPTVMSDEVVHAYPESSAPPASMPDR